MVTVVLAYTTPPIDAVTERPAGAALPFTVTLSYNLWHNVKFLYSDATPGFASAFTWISSSGIWLGAIVDSAVKVNDGTGLIKKLA